MKVEHAAIDAALDEINDRQFRVRLDALTGSCPTCGASRLHVALQSISDQGDEPTCAVCAGTEFELLSRETIEKIVSTESGVEEETTYDGRKLRWTKEAREQLLAIEDKYQKRRANARI